MPKFRYRTPPRRAREEASQSDDEIRFRLWVPGAHPLSRSAGVKDGSPVPWPCEEPERVDALRAEAGIERFAAYVAQFARA